MLGLSRILPSGIRRKWLLATQPADTAAAYAVWLSYSDRLLFLKGIKRLFYMLEL